MTLTEKAEACVQRLKSALAVLQIPSNMETDAHCHHLSIPVYHLQQSHKTVRQVGYSPHFPNKETDLKYLYPSHTANKEWTQGAFCEIPMQTRALTTEKDTHTDNAAKTPLSPCQYHYEPQRHRDKNSILLIPP